MVCLSFVQAYEPEVMYYEHQKPTEEALIERINLRRVKHAIEVHKKMEKLGMYPRGMDKAGTVWLRGYKTVSCSTQLSTKFFISCS